MAQLVGSTCVVCQSRIGAVYEGRFCEACGHPAHDACLHREVLTVAPGNCDRCGSDVSDAEAGRHRSETLRHEEWRVHRLRDMQTEGQDLAEKGVYREGKLLIVGRDADLPNTCVKCNGPCEAPKLPVTFHWRPGSALTWWLAGLVLGPFVGVALAGFRETIRLGLCTIHRAQRRRRRLAAFVVGAITVLVLLTAAYRVLFDEFPTDRLSAFGIFLIGSVFALLGGWSGIKVCPEVVRARRIEGGFIWIDGPCQEFLSQFPQRGQMPPLAGQQPISG